MKRIKLLAFVILALFVLTFALTGRSPNETEANVPTDVVIAFDSRQITERVWEGPATGGAAGTVTIEALNVPPALFKGTWAGATRWQVVAGANSFTAEMTGKINTYNGVLAMRGKVIGGANAGAAVTANAQIASINPHHFVGTMRVVTP